MNSIGSALFHSYEVIRDLEIDINRYIDIYHIISSYEIHYKFIELKDGVDGAFRILGIKKLIIINSNIQNENRKRFTAAHELGHILLRHPPTICNSNIHRWRDSLPSYEQEANQFAIELLLPIKAIRVYLKREDVSLIMIKNVAKHYLVSLTATAVRLISLTKDRSVLIIHNKDKVKWKFHSQNAFLDIDEAGIQNNIIIESLNRANPYNKHEIDARVWLSNDWEIYSCKQETQFLWKRQEYMTLLTFEEID